MKPYPLHNSIVPGATVRCLFEYPLNISDQLRQELSVLAPDFQLVIPKDTEAQVTEVDDHHVTVEFTLDVVPGPWFSKQLRGDFAHYWESLTEPVVLLWTPAQALDEARKLWDAGKQSKALDFIFDVFDDHHLAGRFNAVDEVLQGLDPETLPLTLRIGVLTITNLAKNQLPSRAGFYQRVKDSIQDEPADRQKGLIGGLE